MSSEELSNEGSRQATALAGQRILVTGGAGFIGCALSHLLAPRVAAYLALDNLHPQVHPRSVRPARLHPAAELLIGDVTDPRALERALATPPDVVIHLAAETGTGQSLTEASRHGSVNVVGTTQLTDALGRQKITPKLVVLSSSRAVYGEGAWRRADGSLHYPGLRTREQLEAGRWDFEGSWQPASATLTHPAPTSVYGATKLAQEHILRAWCASMKVPLSVFRFQNVYGPGQSLTNSYTGIVALFCRMALRGEAIPLYEDGRITRDFVFIDDVVSAVAAAVEQRRPGLHTWDVGSGAITTVEGLAREIAVLYGAPAPAICGRFRDGDVRHAGCEIAATQAELGWSPSFNLGRGLQSLRAWIDRELQAS